MKEFFSEYFTKMKKSAIIAFAILGVVSLFTTFIRYRLAKKMLKTASDDVEVGGESLNTK